MNFIENTHRIHVWVFAPYLITSDDNLNYYLDYSQSKAEYERVFAEIGCHWTWVDVTVNNVQKVIQDIEKQTSKTNIVINLCDGDDVNGSPGVRVIEALDKTNMIYSGANAYFYNITTSKIPMKEAFDKQGVATPKWKVVKENMLFEELQRDVGHLMIVKPAVSAGSMGISLKNVVDTEGAFLSVVENIKNGYRGWKLDRDGIFIEAFIKGREFTLFLVGSHSEPEKIIFYPPIERVFHASLPAHERFLSFDRLWERYDQETRMPDNGHFYKYHSIQDEALTAALKDLCIRAYNAVKGIGYGRLDIRMDTETSELYVLEVNAQCSISENEDGSTVGGLLRIANKSFTQLITEILQDALDRH